MRRRLYVPGNDTSDLAELAPMWEVSVTAVTVDELLSFGVPGGVDAVVVTPEPTAPVSDDLVDPHRRTDGLVVVSARPPELSRGQRGAFAGLGRPWSVGVDLLRPHVGAASEMELRRRLWDAGAMVAAVPGAPDEAPVDYPIEKVTWVVHDATRPADVEHLEPLFDVPGVEAEVVLAARGTVERALEAATGTVVWFVHRSLRPDRRLVARMWKRLADERVEAVRSAIAHRHGVASVAADLSAVDRLLEAPAFAVIRRRAMAKTDPPRPWSGALAVERVAVVSFEPPVLVPSRGPWFTRPRLPATPPPAPTEAPPSDDRPKLGYVGFSGQGNFGDDLMLDAIRRLFPHHRVEPGSDHGVGVILGGGTLLNAERFYWRIAERITPIGAPRVVFGTGVVSPEVDGWTEPIDAWRWFLDGATVGVRGPHSLAHLRAWGWNGPAGVVGDPALVMQPERATVPGRVVVAPIGISDVGQIDRADEAAQLDLLTEAIGRWLADGRDVQMFAAYPGDDLVIDDLCERIGVDLPRVAAHRSVADGLAAVASADTVVAARLHVIVAAAAAGVPFMGLAYRPKLVDFAVSVGAEERVRPITRWTPDDLVADADPLDATVERVTLLRARLHGLAAEFAADVAGSQRP